MIIKYFYVILFFCLTSYLTNCFAKICFAKDVEFEKIKIKVGNEELQVEIADTQEKTARGLMHRKKLLDGTGMLFIFQNEEIRNFWMKNTFIALSIGFFDSKEKLIDIQDMEPVQSEMELNIPTYSSVFPAKYALEVPRGWFKKKKIKLGSSLNIYKGK